MVTTLPHCFRMNDLLGSQLIEFCQNFAMMVNRHSIPAHVPPLPAGEISHAFYD